MPSYLVSAKDAYVPQELYHPNFQAIQSIWSTKQAQYNQGLNELQNIYSSIYNSDVTNTQNAERKKQYIENANQQFKNLSQIDLSIQHNVDQSKGVFKPFEQDIALQRDIVATHKYQQGYAHAQALQDSSKAEDRDRYWDGGVKLLQIGQQRLQNGDPNDSSIYNVQGWVDNYNVQKELGAMAQDEKLDISWTTGADGPQLLTIHNGEHSQKAFENWAANKLYSDQRYIDYTKARGVLAAHDKMTEIQQQYAINGAHLSDSEAMHIVGQQMYETDHKNAMDSLNANKVQLSKLNKEVADLRNSKTVPSEQDIKEFNNKLSQIDQLNQNIDRANSQLSTLNSDATKQAYLENFNNIGGDLMAKRFMDRDIHNFADTYSKTHASFEYKENTAYNHQQDRLFQKKKLQNDIFQKQEDRKLTKYGIDKREETSLLKGKFKTDASGHVIGSNGTTADGSAGSASYTDQGYALTDIKQIDPAAQFEDAQHETLTNAYINAAPSLLNIITANGDLFIDGTKSSSSFAATKGYTLDYNTANQMSSTLKDYLNTDDTTKFLQDHPKFQQLIAHFQKDDKSIHYGNKASVIQGIKNYADSIASGIKDPDKRAAFDSNIEDIITMEQTVQSVTSKQEQYEKKVGDYAKAHPEDKNFFYTDGDGASHLVNSNTISKKLKTIKAPDGTELDPKVLATAYALGKVKIIYKGGNVASAEGGYPVLSMGGREIKLSYDTPGFAELQGLGSKYGSSENFYAKTKDIQNNSVSSMDNDKIMGSKVSFDIGTTETTSDKPGNKILTGVQTGVDWLSNVTDSQGNILEKEDFKSALSHLSPKDFVQGGITGKTITALGDKAISFHINDSGQKKLEAAGVDKDIIKGLMDGSLEYHISENSTASFLNLIPSTAKIQYNSELLNGISATPTEKAKGFDYDIASADGGGVNSKLVNFRFRNKYIDENGDEKWTDYKTIQYDLSQYNIEDIRNLIKQARTQNFRTLYESKKAFDAKKTAEAKANGGAPVTYDDYYKLRQKNG